MITGKNIGVRVTYTHEAWLAHLLIGRVLYTTRDICYSWCLRLQQRVAYDKVCCMVMG